MNRNEQNCTRSQNRTSQLALRHTLKMRLLRDSSQLQKLLTSGYAVGDYERNEFTLEKIESAMPFDVAVLTPHSPSHQPLAMAVNWHGKAWSDALQAFKPFLARFGSVPEELKHSIYENHFIAKKEIYQDYVKNWLIPAIEFIGEEPVFFAPSGYTQKKRDSEEISRVHRLLKSNDWPILPFILERLFSFYLNNKNLNVIKI
jgi:hypothetical protein